jgi:RNA polymerase sigma-32 factor
LNRGVSALRYSEKVRPLVRGKEPTMASATSPRSPDASLSRYLREVRKFSLLSAEEEVALARRWRDHKDVKAVNLLVTAHLGLVVKIARGYRGYGLPLAELISEGNIGMMQAAMRFDAERGFRLATYAMWWIRAAVQEYVLRSSSMVRVGSTAAQKRLFFNLRRLKVRMDVFGDGDLAPEQVSEIAEKLDVAEQDVIRMNRRLAGPDRSLNAPARTDGEEEWQDWLVDETESQETAMAEREEMDGRKVLLAGALKTLKERERNILFARRLKDKPATLEELSQHYRISRERVRQIEVQAFGRLQKAMKAEIANRGSASSRLQASATRPASACP